ncbi:MAG: alpha-glucuronidase [Oscillospiraceae bacterium]|nr:alpha-glucuronidase [Oscillospiraceae bacterium]MCL2279442.1 alpha-glucuronidase [Oscillospiraceae bacterium]
MAYSEYKMWLQDNGRAPPVVNSKIEERILNHWDNIDGSVERGYSGRSLFFSDGNICYDTARIRDYARLLASIGINRVCCNNVNVTERSARMITEKLLPDVAKLAAVFREFGIRFIIAVDFTSPRLLGGLTTYDPLDETVTDWWKKAADDVYKHIPDLAGFLVKADSEFRDGPAALGRTQADGANSIARALKPHGGKVYWRCFVYNCVQDWRDKKTDRPKAAYDHFFPLDGFFDDNVILQIKHGPSDYQVREPNSPLLGAMKHTNQAIELQVTQEYTGQQIDLYALAVQWEEIFSAPISDTRTMRDLMGREVTAIAAVANTGLDMNWTGHTLAQANLYSFGRLACDPSLTARAVLSEWIYLTFSNNPKLHEPLLEMMLKSRSVYEKYTTPLGLCWMVNINHHYGPSPEGYEFMKWGTYHRANREAIGVDRTEKGTGYTAQYHPYLNKLYSDKETCPEELLLYFHRLPYDYRLKCGKTLLQYMYDSHFEGYDEVEGFIKTWDSLKPFLPEYAYSSVAERLQQQLKNASEWRDVVNTYFYRLTNVADANGRVIYE